MKKTKKLITSITALSLTLFFVSCSFNPSNKKKIQGNTVSEETTKEEKKQKEVPTESSFNSLLSLKQLKDFKGVYTFEYNGDYQLDNLIKADLTDVEKLKAYLETNIELWKTAKEKGIEFTTQEVKPACTSIVANSSDGSGGKIYGRNFDYDWPEDTVLIIHTIPYEGYESISTSFPIFLAGKFNWEPVYDESDIALRNNAVAIGAIYAPMDGMNEKGFYISILEAGDEEQTAQNELGKNSVITSVAVRYLLDKADTVDTALELLRDVNMYSVFGTSYHFAMADSKGKSVVVEYVGNKMYVTETKVVTNHYISTECGKAAPDAYNNTAMRFKVTMEAGNNANWYMTPEQIRDALESVKYSQYRTDGLVKTIWSAVYEPEAEKITYYFREDFTKPIVLSFEDFNK